MASTGLLSPAVLGFRVRRRGQPSVSVSICRVAVLGVSPHQLMTGVENIWVFIREKVWLENSLSRYPVTLLLFLVLLIH